MKQIVENYKYSIKKIIRNITGRQDEDLEQEVYIKTWRNLNKYSEKGKFKNWINTITSNICRDYMRSARFKNNKNTVDDCLLKIEDTKPNPESILLQKQRQTRIISAINGLKPKYKQVIILYEIKEYNYEEIAKIIKCPIGTVKSRLYNARKELGSILEDLI